MFPSSSAFPPVCPPVGAALQKRARPVQVCVSGDLVLSECRVVGAGACGGFTQVRPAGSGCHAMRVCYPMLYWMRRHAHTQARTEMPTGTHALVNTHTRTHTHTQHARAHAHGRAQVDNTFEIHTHDKFGNALVAGGHVFDALLWGPERTVASVLDRQVPPAVPVRSRARARRRARPLDATSRS
jgi:hypothetical protein